jgi:hypothetical protein
MRPVLIRQTPGKTCRKVATEKAIALDQANAHAKTRSRNRG